MIDGNQKIELFDKFYDWLKADGLKPKTSERLHRKKIFSSLLNNNQMTLDNFNDFLLDIKIQEIKNLQNQMINYQNQLLAIDEVTFNKNLEEFTLKNLAFNINIKCKFNQLAQIQSLVHK
ncbi:hypothetical protein AVENP_1017 [Arcobacter venerupis]|uniref:Uncharacterized protein n=1 Tax=Arcobacter venerupis TaxID=1054033 RepID=A0AAE7BA31_9BACT|nr:hypothetical protein [Arcobacter venerupis]QKF66572.1 hypothetical protein AVENP_1017 [Arcobacter venerupis]RWS49690.1 hypothetical protein CKA56_08195 [Arcobacter venerupis]